MIIEYSIDSIPRNHETEITPARKAELGCGYELSSQRTGGENLMKIPGWGIVLFVQIGALEVENVNQIKGLCFKTVSQERHLP